MSTKTSGGLDVSSWLAELHMECYKKNLEDYETIKPLLELKESDIKKLGVANSKDRARMMTSLAGYKKSASLQESGFIPVAGPLAQAQESHKSLLRKSSLKKLNIKSFLGSGSSKKSKNSKKTSTDSIQITELPNTEAVPEEVLTLTPGGGGDHTPFPGNVAPPSTENSVTPLSVVNNKPVSSTLADYEELPDVVSPLVRSMTVDVKSASSLVSRHPTTVENEYVPSPENSPNFSNQRMRANTIAVTSPTYGGSEFHYPQHQHQQQRSGFGSLYQPSLVSGLGGRGVDPSLSSSSSSHVPHPTPPHHHPYHAHHQGEQFSGNEDDSPGPLTHKHLSVVSMESGLSFGYDVEKDFNPAHPLESQPWFHGKIARLDAESFLHEDGDFLVRENTTMANTHTLTLRWRGVADHTLIGTTEVISNNSSSSLRGTAVKYQFDSGAFDSIPELIYNHLKYQIPIDIEQHTLITNPVCRPGNQTKGAAAAAGGGGMFGFYSSHQQRGNWSPDSSPAASTYSAGSSQRRSGSPAEYLSSAAPRGGGVPIRLGMPVTPPLLSRRHLSNSSGDLLEATREEVEVSLRNVISPPPDSRGRAMTLATPTAESLRRSVSGSSTPRTTPSSMPLASSDEPPPECSHQKMDSMGDYEVMESVSILKDSPSLAEKRPHTPQEQDMARGRDYAQVQSLSAGNTLNRPPRERVKYAEIRYLKNHEDGRGGVIISSGSNTVNYAEVRFARSNTYSSPSQQQHQKPHPFATGDYDIVPPGRREATPPRGGQYQSRAELLSQRLAEPTYSTPVPAASRRPPSAHPMTNYATIQFPRQSSLPSTQLQSVASKLHPQNSSPQIPSSSLLPPPPQQSLQQPSSGLVSQLLAKTSPVPSPRHHHAPHSDHSPADSAKLSRHSGRSQDLTSSNDSLISATSSASSSHSPAHHHKRVIGSSLVHSHAPSTKVHKSLPGYEALVKAHTVLQNHSNEELAYHMTRTDAVCFLLAPRPGEDKGIWKERVRMVTSSSGAFCGLQTLADPDGEKLWKKLYFRHLNLAQTVTLTVITAGDALERAKLIHRYILVADLLRGEKYANLFSFIGIMQGLAAPQLTNMSDVWSLLSSHYPEEVALYKTLQGVVTSIDQGEEVIAPERLIIPPIQHLKAVFHFSEQHMVGFAPVAQDYSIVGEYTTITTALTALRTIVAHTASFTINGWKTLEGLQYNVKLMEFLMQDFTRVYLQAINVQSDDPLERRRRFGLLMDALVDRVESDEAV